MRRFHNVFEDTSGSGCNKGVTPLYALSFHGYHGLVKTILFEEQIDVNAQGGPYGSALQAASYKGHDRAVEMLLEHRAPTSTHKVERTAMLFTMLRQKDMKGLHESYLKIGLTLMPRLARIAVPFALPPPVDTNRLFRYSFGPAQMMWSLSSVFPKTSAQGNLMKRKSLLLT